MNMVQDPCLDVNMDRSFALYPKPTVKLKGKDTTYISWMMQNL
jgi:hypothetical protein